MTAMTIHLATPGQLTLEGPHTLLQTYSLQPGPNTIGRMMDAAQQPQPGELLLDTDDILIHRQYHCQVDVVGSTESGWQHQLSIAPQATNPTCLGVNQTQPLHVLDKVLLPLGSTFYIGTTAVHLRA